MRLKIFFLIFALVLPGQARAQINVLVNFSGTGGTAPGDSPKGSLIIDGSTLYGFTSGGGTDDSGVIFSVSTDGSGYTVLTDFTATGNTTGNQPHHGFATLEGDTLIRPILAGGSTNNGTIFSVQTDGSASTPTPSYTFTGLNNAPTSLGDGSQPHSGLLAAGGSLYYGVTAAGGTNNKGVLYFYNSSNQQVTTLYAFDDSTGSESHGQLIWDSTGTLLLGMTRKGGTGTGSTANGNETPGVIFSFNPANPSSYTVLYNFDAATANSPYFTDHGILTLGTGTKNSSIFGMTEYGGTGNQGAIFSLSENGATSLTVLHSFSGGSSDGADPFGSLVLGPDGYLYGLTRTGGVNNEGVLFRIAQDGSGFLILDSFDGSTTGKNPIDNVTFSADGTMLYGLVEKGGTSGDGTIFSFNLSTIPEPETTALLGCGGLLTVIFASRKRFTSAPAISITSS